MCWKRCSPLSAFGAACALTIGMPSAARAQSLEHITGDSVVSMDVFGGENVSNQPQVIVDAAAAVRIGENWRVHVRPWLRQARPSTPTGARPPWDIELYEAGVRYERPGTVAVRVDAGYISSPMGIGLFDWRPNDNPTIVPHLSYVVPLPAFDPTLAVRPTPVANSYPLAGAITLAARRWDARAAILNSSPTRAYVVGNTNVNPKQTPNLVLGGGITPTTGLRLGTSFAHGVYATAAEIAPRSAYVFDRHATTVSGEGEYAFGYTSLRGEVLRTRFETATGSAAATEWFLQGTHILSARWFAAARIEHVSGPTAFANPAARTDLDMSEVTAGFRLNRDLTLRSSYYARRSYNAAAWDHQAGFSMVWARRWW